MSTLFESAIGDIIDVIGAVSDVVADKDNEGIAKIIKRKFGGDSPYKGSITSQANKLVMTFPVLMSDTISPSTALMISKAIERKMVVLLQMLFASAALVSTSDRADIKDIINQYYTGIDFKTMSVDDVMKIMEKLDLSEGQLSDLRFTMKTAERILSEANMANLRMPVQELSSFNEDGLDKFSIGNDGIRAISEANKRDSIKGKIKDELEDLRGKRFQSPDEDNYLDDLADRLYFGKKYSALDDTQRRQVLDFMKYDQYVSSMTIDQLNKELDDMAKTAQSSYDRQRLKLSKNKDRRDAEAALRDAEMHKMQLANMKNREERDAYIHQLNTRQTSNQLVTQRLDFAQKQLLASDVKKCNEMVPSMLFVDFYVQTTGDPIRGTGIIGVKTRIVPVSSAEIVDRIASKSKAKAGLVNLIRATTGETKFMKDFILNVDRAKVDALARSKRGSVNPMWRVLERRANKQALRKALQQKNDASPITTLILTTEEVDYLKKTQAIDLNNVSIATDLLDAYNLLGIGIVDESAELVKFLWDGEMNGYEPLSFLAMEKEDRDNGGMYKKVINLMAKNA